MSKTYIALDIETTGLSPERDAIIEIGAVKFQDRRVIGKWSSLVNPTRAVPYKIQQLTGISQMQVEKAPPLRTLIPTLQDFVRDLPIVGHNVSFDLSFFNRGGFLTTNPSIDTFELASILMPHVSRYSLGKLTEELGISLPSAHRALHDARAAKDLFLALLERAVDLDVRTVQEINRAAAQANWNLKVVFREVERAQAHHAFGGSIGQQLREKGFLDGQGGASLFSSEREELPLRPAAVTQRIDVNELAAMLQEGGRFAQEFGGFEYRPQQVDMMRCVAEAFNRQGRRAVGSDSRKNPFAADGEQELDIAEHRIIEAGTGTGKSLAYLLPAMYFAVQNSEHVVISTNTINLQEQLYTKDVPDLERLVPFKARTTLLKGRSHYLCLHRLGVFRRRTDLSPVELTVLAKVLAWLPTTATGDEGEYFLPDPRQRAIWSQLNAAANICLNAQCTYRDRCFFYAARERAEASHLIIVNHSLLLADVAVEGHALPEYRYLIIDEAHNLEAACTSQLTQTLTQESIAEMVGESGARPRSLRPTGLLADIAVRARQGAPKRAIADIDTFIDQIRREAELVLTGTGAFFDALTGFLAEHSQENEGQSNYTQKTRITPQMRLQPGWTDVEIAADNLSVRTNGLRGHLEHLRAALAELIESAIPEIERLVEETGVHARRWGELLASLKMMAAEPSAHLVYWAEVSPDGARTSLHAAPISVSELIRKQLLDTKKSVIMTSATLTADSQFDYIQDRLGAGDVQTKMVGSPFDYSKSTKILIPTDIPEPRQPYHQRAVDSVIRDLALALEGRTMALFTSYAQLRSTSRAIAPELEEHEIIVYEQGDGMSRHQLLESFKTSPRAVLMGTRSFWEGIDIPGEALSCLILVRLPFAVPTDPIVSARSETFEDPFREYSLPDAILRFRQGFGRLIRTKTDRGVVVILDKRVLNKSYGQSFLDSLPACSQYKGPSAHLPDEAKRWLDKRA